MHAAPTTTAAEESTMTFEEIQALADHVYTEADYEPLRRSIADMRGQGAFDAILRVTGRAPEQPRARRAYIAGYLDAQHVVGPHGAPIMP